MNENELVVKCRYDTYDLQQGSGLARLWVRIGRFVRSGKFTKIHSTLV
jgi:hypothetical protein